MVGWLVLCCFFLHLVLSLLVLVLGLQRSYELIESIKQTHHVLQLNHLERRVNQFDPFDGIP